MKKTIAVSLAALCAVCASASNPAARIAGAPVSKYTVVYQASAEPEEGNEAVSTLCALVEKATGVSVKAVSSEAAPKSRTISFVNSQRAEGIPTPLKPFEYSITTKNGNVTVDAGGAWAMEKASRIIAGKLETGNIPSNFQCRGTVEGEFLFPRAEEVNLRILDDNVWDNSTDTIQEAWEKIGVDPRDKVRAPEFAQLVRAYMPDIICLQEYNPHLDAEFYPLIRKYGYLNSYESGEDYNNTPVFYNPEAVKPLAVNFHLFTPAKYSNHGSKSFTSAIFVHKASGHVFAVISTHLWWKSDKAQPGSTQARASQVRLIMAECEEIRQAYSCPIFVMGDMNCEENSIPMQQFIQGGYTPCYRIATVFGDNCNGHHICGPVDGYSRVSRRRGPERPVGAIDHCFLWNDRGAVEIKVFDCIEAEFTVKLTDHYPNIIDAVI